jgi:hypothetical protein
MAAPTYDMYLLNVMARPGICPSAHDSWMGQSGAVLEPRQRLAPALFEQRLK